MHFIILARINAYLSSFTMVFLLCRSFSINWQKIFHTGGEKMAIFISPLDPKFDEIMKNSAWPLIISLLGLSRRKKYDLMSEN